MRRAQDDTCSLCGDALRFDFDFPNNPKRCTFDHIVPRSLYGEHKLRNLALAHSDCNNVRGNGKLTRAQQRRVDARDAKLDALEELIFVAVLVGALYLLAHDVEPTPATATATRETLGAAVGA